jgi:hypothetical protein
VCGSELGVRDAPLCDFVWVAVQNLQIVDAANDLPLRSKEMIRERFTGLNLSGDRSPFFADQNTVKWAGLTEASGDWQLAVP